MDSCFKCGIFPFLANSVFNFFPGFFNHFFNSCRMNSPSRMSFSRVILAISLLIGSNPERITASGVSSIMRSIPVSVSRVLIFLPSRPIIYPSSHIRKWNNRNGNFRYVISRTFLNRHGNNILCPDLCLFFSLASMSLIRIAISCFTSFSTFFSRTSFASSTDSPDILSSSATCCLCVSSVCS